MIADKNHAEYAGSSLLWSKCRDVIAGQEAVHLSGTRYLPKLDRQTPKQYEAYVGRALFYGATGRTLDAMTGLLFRKEPQVDIPSAADEWTDNIDLAGLPLLSFAQKITEEVISVGRVGILVDMPEARTDVMTAEQAASVNMRPFARMYRAEDILNWRITVVAGATKLSFVLLSETVDMVDKDGNTVNVEQRRVLDLDDGSYRVRLFRKDETKQWAMISEVWPVSSGTRLLDIPFVFINPQDLTPEVKQPPLLSLVNVNLSHYRTTADYEHGAHYTALPTAVITGHAVTDDDGPLCIGSGEAWAFPEPEAKAFFLEYTGQGLGALEKLLDRKEAMMAAIGARILAADKRVAEAAETETIRRSGENSVLASIAGAVSSGLTKMMQVMCDWFRLSGDVSVQLNRDFLPVSMSASELTAVVGAWQSGAISEQELFETLKAGELIRDDKTFDEHQAEIADQGPAMGEVGRV